MSMAHQDRFSMTLPSSSNYTRSVADTTFIYIVVHPLRECNVRVLSGH